MSKNKSSQKKVSLSELNNHTISNKRQALKDLKMLNFDELQYKNSAQKRFYNTISTNNPVTPPVRNEPTSAEILATTSIPNQPDPKITVDRIETDTNDANTPLIPPNTSPIVENILFTFMIFPPIYLLIRMNNLL